MQVYKFLILETKTYTHSHMLHHVHINTQVKIYNQQFVWYPEPSTVTLQNEI